MDNPTKSCGDKRKKDHPVTDNDAKEPAAAKKPPVAGNDEDEPPAKKPAIRKGIDKHFFSSKDQIVKNINQIKTHASKQTVVAIKFYFEESILYKNDAELAEARSDWDAAAEAYDKFKAVSLTIKT